mmetsp:Transcript_19049/g.31264  ORF Transcript_19049/g.31264 Transcript_19049/m.31264 type:complete len:659 (-) Transcript_19049:71-2047(-)
MQGNSNAAEMERLPTEGDRDTTDNNNESETAAADADDDAEIHHLPLEEDRDVTERTPAAAAAAAEGHAVADGEEDVVKKIEEADAADDIEKGNIATADLGNHAEQNDRNANHPNISSQPGVLFVPGPDFRGGIHTGYHSAHESDDDNNDEGNVNVGYEVADTVMVEGTLVPEEPEIPTYEATLVPEETLQSPEVTSKWYKTPFIICGGFTIVGVALAIGLPLGLRTAAENDPTVSSRPSLRPSSYASISPTSTPFFKKKGQPKNGNAPIDLFGGSFSLSTDGSTVAVGAAQLGPIPNRSGYVVIMKWNETLSDYEQLGEPIFGENYGDGFGYACALSGDASKLAIGTPYHDTNGEQSGHVKIYLWNEDALNYTHTGDILYGAKAGDLFGDTLQMSSDGITLAIGASSSDTNSSDAGEVNIYRWNDTDSSFRLNGVLYGDQGDRFGYSVSVSPDNKVIAVGAQNARYVKTYAWDSDDMFYKQRGLPIYDDPRLRFGRSCSVSDGGMYLAIGSLHESGGDDNSTTPGEVLGQVQVFQWNGTQYNQVGDTLLGDGNVDDFGSSIGISRDGKILVVGAPMNDSINGVQSGQVQLFNLNDSGSNYNLYGEPLVGEASSNYFGGPVGIAGDAKSFAVGAVGNGRKGEFSGQLQLFHLPQATKRK